MSIDKNSDNRVTNTIKEFFETKDASKIRNVSIIAHVDHGKTTLTDNILSEGGLINKELAGQQLATDCFKVEKERGITINTTNVNFLYEGHLINLFDSPGHIDFNEEVIKSVRSSDGAVLVVDIIEGCKPQTEVVLAQALNEGLKIILFVNKVDRIMKELYMDSEQVLLRLRKTVNEINQLFRRLTNMESDYFNLTKNVIFGSALYNWATSITNLMERKKSFKQILENLHQGNQNYLKSEFPLAKLLIRMIIKEVNSPLENQKNKIIKTYMQNEKTLDQIDQDILSCNSKGPFKAIVTDVNYDPFAGLVTTLRVLSGQYSKKENKILYKTTNGEIQPIKAPTKQLITYIKSFEEIPCSFAGTIVVFQGTEELRVGDTLTDVNEKFEYPVTKSSRSPIISYALTPEKLADLKKMIESIKNLVIEDPSLKYEYLEQTGEFKLYGVGMLHLEIAITKLDVIYGIKVKASEPVVEYCETLKSEKSKIVQVRSPNKLNDFEFYISKLPDNLTQQLLRNKITNKNLRTACEEAGIPKDLAKKAERILSNGCIYFNATKGCNFMDQTRDNIVKSIEAALSTGYKLKRAIKGVAFVITDAIIHMDGLHRGINQLRSAFRKGLEEIFESNSLEIVEPILLVDIEAPFRFGNKINEYLESNRGASEQVLDSLIEGYVRIRGTLPLAESVNMSPLLMTLTEGRVIINTDLYGYRPVPLDIWQKIVNEKKAKLSKE